MNRLWWLSELGRLACSAVLLAQTISGGYQGNPVINVKSTPFQAMGDGIADDTAAFQAAFDYAAKAGSTQIDVPAGTYVISSPLTVTASNIELRGHGPASRLLSGRNSFTMSALLDIHGTSSVHISGVRVANLRISSGRETNASSYQAAVRVEYAERSLISGLVIDGFAAAGATPHSSSVFGVYVGRGAIDTVVSHNTVTMPRAYIDAVGGYNIGLASLCALSDAFNGHLSGAAPSAPTNRGTRMLNNHIRYGQYGFQVTNSTRFLARSNFIDSPYYRGFEVNMDTSYATFAGNEIHNPGSTGFVFAYGPNHLQVVHNTIDTTSIAERTGIEMYYDVSDAQITRNLIRNTQDMGIRVAYRAARINISNNIISGVTAGQPIRVEGGMAPTYTNLLSGGGRICDIMIRNNHIRAEAGTWGIALIAKQRGTLQGNVPFTDITVTGNEVFGGAYGVVYVPNADSPSASTRVRIDSNRLTGQNKSAVLPANLGSNPRR